MFLLGRYNSQPYPSPQPRFIFSISDSTSFLPSTPTHHYQVELEPRYPTSTPGEPELGPPHTSKWQQVYEPRVFGGMQANEFLHGVLCAVDGMDLACMQTRKLKPGYAVPEAFSAALRRNPKWWFPFLLCPSIAGTPALKRAVLREILTIALAPLDGVVHHRYVVGGVERYAIFGLQASTTHYLLLTTYHVLLTAYYLPLTTYYLPPLLSAVTPIAATPIAAAETQNIVLDGEGQMEFAFLRQNGLSCCPRCMLPTSMFGTQVDLQL